MIPLAVPIAAGLLGRLLGNAAKGSADQRMSENNQRLTQAGMQGQYGLNRAQSMNSDALSRANLDLNRRAFSQQEPTAQARQALMGSLLERIQPMALSGVSDRVHIPTLNNSIISAIGPEAREAGALLAQRGLSGLQSGGTKFPELPASITVPEQMPYLSQALQKSSLLEKLLGAGGLIGSTVGVLGDLRTPTSGNGLPIDPYGGG